MKEMQCCVTPNCLALNHSSVLEMMWYLCIDSEPEGRGLKKRNAASNMHLDPRARLQAVGQLEKS